MSSSAFNASSKFSSGESESESISTGLKEMIKIHKNIRIK
jgi:hypothetical protein